MSYLPPGARLIEDFVSEAEERYLLDHVDEEKWEFALRRRTQQYGYRYNYREHTVKRLKDPLGHHTWWLEDLMKKMNDEVGFNPTQAIVNEYLPGQTIAPHVDAPCFGPVIASLSLSSTWRMGFERTNEALRVMLPRRSLLVMIGESRSRWSHSISSSQEVLERRVSITFRTVNDEMASNRIQATRPLPLAW